MNNDQTSVDVVIPSYRPDEKFSRLVKKLQEQEYPKALLLFRQDRLLRGFLLLLQEV